MLTRTTRSTKSFDGLMPRLQRFRLRTLEYDFSIGHVPGRQLCTADVLSRNPLADTGVTLENVLTDYEAHSIDLMPASYDMLSRIRNELKADATLSRVMEHCSTQWSQQRTLPDDVKKFATVSDELSIADGLSGTRLVIPPSLRDEVLERLYTGHQGITRYRARAREAVWWPVSATNSRATC